jgi:hypothetical protein
MLCFLAAMSVSFSNTFLCGRPVARENGAERFGAPNVSKYVFFEQLISGDEHFRSKSDAASWARQRLKIEQSGLKQPDQGVCYPPNLKFPVQANRQSLPCRRRLRFLRFPSLVLF